MKTPGIVEIKQGEVTEQELSDASNKVVSELNREVVEQQLK